MPSLPSGGSLKEKLSRPKMVHARWMVSGGAIRVIVAFGGNLVLVRFISPEGFGEFALVMATIGLLLAFHPLRLQTQIIRVQEHAFDAATRQLYFSALVHEVVLLGSAALFWLYLVGLWRLWSLLLLASMLLNHFTNNVRAFYERKSPYRRLAVVETGAHLGGYIAAIVLAVGGLGAGALFIREAVVALGTFAFLGLIGGLTWYKVRLIRLTEWRELLRQVRGIWLDGVLENSLQRLLIIMATIIGGTQGAGYFFQAHRLANLPHQLLSPVVGRLSLNWFSRVEADSIRRNNRRRLLRYAVWATSLAALAAVLFAEPVIPVLFGPNWIPVIPILKYLSGYIMFISLFAILKMYFIATQDTRNLLAARIVQYLFLAGVPLLYGLGYQVGVASLGLGLSLAFTASFVVSLWLVHVRDKALDSRSTPPEQK